MHASSYETGNILRSLSFSLHSSSFDLSQQIGEPLTGRKETIILYPLSQKELNLVHNKHELREKLSDFLVFGSYPEVLTAKSKAEKMKILNEIKKN